MEKIQGGFYNFYIIMKMKHFIYFITFLFCQQVYSQSVDSCQFVIEQYEKNTLLYNYIQNEYTNVYLTFIATNEPAFYVKKYLNRNPAMRLLEMTGGGKSDLFTITTPEGLWNKAGSGKYEMIPAQFYEGNEYKFPENTLHKDSPEQFSYQGLHKVDSVWCYKILFYRDAVQTDTMYINKNTFLKYKEVSGDFETVFLDYRKVYKNYHHPFKELRLETKTKKLHNEAITIEKKVNYDMDLKIFDPNSE